MKKRGCETAGAPVAMETSLLPELQQRRRVWLWLSGPSGSTAAAAV